MSLETMGLMGVLLHGAGFVGILGGGAAVGLVAAQWLERPICPGCAWRAAALGLSLPFSARRSRLSPQPRYVRALFLFAFYLLVCQRCSRIHHGLN